MSEKIIPVALLLSAIIISFSNFLKGLWDGLIFTLCLYGLTLMLVIKLKETKE